MKKILFFAIAMLISVASFGQKKGDMFVSGSLATDFGSYTSSSSIDNFATSNKESLGPSLAIGADYGYFVADNVRLGVKLEASFSSTPNVTVDGTTLKTKTVGININPNVAYYVKLADKFYYTPEVGVYLGWDSINNQLSSTETEHCKESTWGFYTNLVSFEYRVSDRVAIGTVIGGIGWYSSLYTYPDVKYKMNQTTCDLNDATVLFRWYF